MRINSPLLPLDKRKFKRYQKLINMLWLQIQVNQILIYQCYFRKDKAKTISGNNKLPLELVPDSNTLFPLFSSFSS